MSSEPKPKYRFFISSTYKDLAEVRKEIMWEVVQMGHIPVGMEQFTPSYTDLRNYIYEWIDLSDIFIILIGNRYGTIDPKTGKSYTEMEFDYAKRKKKTDCPYYIR